MPITTSSPSPSPRAPNPTYTPQTPQTPRTKTRGTSLYGPVTPTAMSESWRLVDGDYESFDAHFLPDSASPRKPATPSFRSSTSFAPDDDGGLDVSQRTIEFTDDERAFRHLREPMEPTMTPGGRRILRPDEVFRAAEEHAVVQRGDFDDQQGTVRRRPHLASSPYKHMELGNDAHRDYDYVPSPSRRHSRDTPTSMERMQDALPGFIYDSLAWTLGLVGQALRFAQKPLAVLLAIYLFIGGLYILQSTLTNSLVSTLSPLCRIPGVGSLPICSSPLIKQGGMLAQIEFDGLMSVQNKFEHVLEKSSSGVSLPLEMKQSEMAVRDLRALVQHSDLPARDEIVTHFDGYVDVARKTARELQLFNTHVGTAVDAVISINRWTLRFLDSAAVAEGQIGDGGADGDSGRSGVVKALMFPIEMVVSGAPARRFSESVLLEKYIEHTAYVSEHIARLILEAQYVLGLLTSAEDHLLLVYAVASREERAVSSQRDAVKWTLRTLIGANSRTLHGFDEQLTLLRRVDSQRSQAVAQVSALIVELENMQAGLEDLRDRVAGPELAQQTPGGAKIPLQVHIDTIAKGVERLDTARGRIRSAENEKLQKTLERGGRVPELDSRMAVAQ